MSKPPKHRPKVRITTELEASIREALRVGDRDAPTLAQEFRVATETIRAIRACLQHIMTVNGEGSLPTPPPTSRTYFKRPFTEVEDKMREEYRTNPKVTPAALADKYGLKYQHVYNSILNRDPSVIAERAREQTKAEEAIVVKAKGLMAKHRSLDKVAEALGMSFNEASSFLHLQCQPEYWEWNTENRYKSGRDNGNIPEHINLERYRATWKLYGQAPSY